MVSHRRSHAKHEHKKRSGKHHSRGRHYLRVYAPYLPLTIIVSLSVLLGSWQPITARRGSTLAYATNTSVGGLLSSTNSQRATNGKTNLTLNNQLNSAAQAKANDMVARNYWAHNTPDGKEPWVFIDSAGYNYSKAGENLAYGFLTSDETVVGWMNSPSHKANLLDSSFSEVGFGFANSSNFNSAGQQTIVVAMYGQPQTLGASNQPAPAAPAPVPASTTPSNPTPPTTPTPTESPTPAPAEKTTDTPAPVTTAQPVAASSPSSQNVTRIQTLTGGRAPWALAVLAAVSGIAVAVLLLRHSLALRHLLRSGERLILHHPLLDVTLVSLALLGLSLSYNVGVIL